MSYKTIYESHPNDRTSLICIDKNDIHLVTRAENRSHLGKNNNKPIRIRLPVDKNQITRNNGKVNVKLFKIKEYNLFDEHSYFRKKSENKNHPVHLKWKTTNAIKAGNVYTPILEEEVTNFNELGNSSNHLDSESHVKKEIILLETNPVDESDYSDLIAEQDPLESLDPLSIQPSSVIDVEQRDIAENEAFIHTQEKKFRKTDPNEENVGEPESNEIVERTQCRTERLVALQCKSCFKRTANFNQENIDNCFNCTSKEVSIVCQKCDRLFSSLRFLRAHIESSDAHDLCELLDVDTLIKSLTRCQKCGARLATAAHLKEHQAECNIYRCPKCSRHRSKVHYYSSLKTLKKHMESSHFQSFVYECTHCSKSRPSKTGFRRHLVKCQPNRKTNGLFKEFFGKDLNLKCCHCSFHSTNLKTAQNHYVKAHFDLDPKEDWNWYYKWIKPIVMHKSMDCHYCDFRTFKKYAIINHLRAKHQFHEAKSVKPKKRKIQKKY